MSRTPRILVTGRYERLIADPHFPKGEEGITGGGGNLITKIDFQKGEGGGHLLESGLTLISDTWKRL